MKISAGLIRPVKIAENLTIKCRTTGFGLKRPGHGVAASFFKGDFGLIFMLGGRSQLFLKLLFFV